MYNQSGEYEGVNWSVEHKGGKLFVLTVGDKVEEYICQYEPVYGMDEIDTQSINMKLDEMQGI